MFRYYQALIDGLTPAVTDIPRCLSWPLTSKNPKDNLVIATTAAAAAANANGVATERSPAKPGVSILTAEGREAATRAHIGIRKMILTGSHLNITKEVLDAFPIAAVTPKSIV